MRTTKPGARMPEIKLALAGYSVYLRLCITYLISVRHTKTCLVLSNPSSDLVRNKESIEELHRYDQVGFHYILSS